MNNLEAKSNIYIKQLVSDDISENFYTISKLLEESYNVSFSNYKVAKDYFNNKLEILLEYISKGQAIAFGAFNSKLIGLIWCYPRLFLNEKRLHINHFVVSELFRGLGIGSMLMKEVEGYAIENEIKIIDLMVTSNSPSVNFYKQNEFFIERYQMIKRL